MLRTFVSRPLRLLCVVAALLICSAASSARADTVNAFLSELSNNSAEANAIGVDISIVDVAGGVQFTSTLRNISNFALGEGDILALWLDIDPTVNLANVAHAPPYDPSNLNITGFVTGHNAIGSAPWGGNPNINGMPSPFAASTKYDMAIRFGTSGMSVDYYPTVSFKLTNITASAFESSRFAARVTSIGADNQDSGKYAGYGEPPIVPTPSAALGGLALLGLGLLRRRPGP